MLLAFAFCRILPGLDRLLSRLNWSIRQREATKMLKSNSIPVSNFFDKQWVRRKEEN